MCLYEINVCTQSTDLAATHKQFNLLWPEEQFEGTLVGDHHEATVERTELSLNAFVQQVVCIQVHKFLETTCFLH